MWAYGKAVCGKFSREASWTVQMESWGSAVKVEVYKADNKVQHCAKTWSME